MKLMKELIFIFSNLMISKTLAHINASNDFNHCNDNKEPIYVLDEDSLGVIGHGTHNYIPICPENIPNYKPKAKRAPEFMSHKKFHHNIHDGQRHNFEYDRPEIEKIGDLIDRVNLTSYKQSVNSGELDFNEEDEKINYLSAFKIEFYCSVTPNICEKARKSFESATQKIAIALKIKTQIIVQASLYSFCDVKQGTYCSSNSSIGSAAASAYHIINNNGTKFLYPQPLVKQMDDIGIYLATDVTADFNADYSFYFSGDDIIEDGQIDFEYVVIHELIHGLGFATAFQKYFSLVAKVIDDQDFLSPGLSLINNTYVSNWRNIQIFDKSVYSSATNTSLNEYNNDIMKFSSSSGLVSPLEYHNEFIRTVQPYKAAKTVLNVASNTTGSLVFQTSEGKRVTLYTKENEFLQGTSIAHLSDEYKYTPDFIMISDVSPLQGKTLSKMFEEYGHDNPYGALGPNVLLILQELGWEIADPPQDIHKFYGKPIAINSNSTTSDAISNFYIRNFNSILIIIALLFIYTLFI